jgi:hypothetical protein
MQSGSPESFDREMGCTEAELLRWLPGASNGRALNVATRQATVLIDSGQLALAWQPLAPRRIALLNVPRLAVSFRFSGVAEASRREFMRYFDLYTQRGGG